jgi:hypothetical protein
MANTPTYILYHGRNTGKDKDGKKIWTRIGAVWPNKKQLLESLRRNSWLPGLSNDRAIRCLGRLFGFEFLGFGYTALADPPGALDLQRCDTVDYAQSCARFLAVSWPRSALSPGGCR